MTELPIFQSTAPVWGPTLEEAYTTSLRSISIHGPRVGADWQHWEEFCGENISIHGPRVGADGQQQKGQR